MSFCPAYSLLRSLEGYYLKDEDGETYAGVTRKFFPFCKIWPLVDQEKLSKRNQKLKNKKAEGILEKFYFNTFYNFELYEEIEDQKIITFLFCQSINIGSVPTFKILQSTLGDVKVDGDMGMKTIKSLNSKEAPVVLDKMKNQTINYYKSIVDKNPSDKKNLAGWINRVKNLIELV